MKTIFKFNNLTISEVINRPSKNIKSPYLADILINDKIEMAHSPGLGLCGFITTGSEVAVTSNDCESRKSNLQ